jgi:hypothetical protein
MTVGITELPPEGMQLPGVALAGDAERGTKTTEGISLLFTSAGVTVQGPQPQIERLLVWSALDSATCREKMQLPDGREAAIMELTSGGQSIRFLLPSESVSPGQAAYLDQALPAWLVRYKGIAAPVAAAPIAPGAEAEVSVALPAPGPNQVAVAAVVQPAPKTPVPAYAAAGAAGAVFGAAGLVTDQPTEATGANGQGMVTGAPLVPPPTMQAPPPPAPSAPVLAAPTMQAPPAPAVVQAPVAPTPVMQAPPAPAVVQAPAAPAPATAWDDPPLGSGIQVEVPVEAKMPKKPKFALTRKQLHAAEAAAAGTAVAGADVDAFPAAPPAAVQAPASEATKAKKPKFALTRKQLHAAEAVAAGTAVAGAVVATSAAPAMAPPSDPVPLVLQPPAPVADQAAPAPVIRPTPPLGGLAPGDGSSLGSSHGSGEPGAGSPVLAESGSKPNRRNLGLLVVLVVVVVAAGGYLISKKNSPTTTTRPAAPTSTAVADATLAGSINLRLADLPSGWTQVPPAQSVIRLPVAPAVAQANAANAMASCLNASYAVVSGLFASGSLPGQTSLVQSPMFASAAGSSFGMAARTTTMTSPSQVQALNGVFTSPKFNLCFQSYQSVLAQAVVPGATVLTQPVSLPAPTGVSTFGMVSTYTLPGIGTAVVGDAYLLGGRIITVIQPTTNGFAIPSEVFSPAYRSVAGRLAASANR